MKKINFLLLLFCFVVSAAAQDEPKQVRVYQSKTDSYELMNVIDLLGEWQSTLSITPTSIISKVPQSFVSLGNGSQVRINDVWVEDYPSRLRNCTWAVVDSRLVLSSPDLGKIELEIIRVGKSAYCEFVLNQVTYRRLVNRSDKRRNAI